MIDISKGRYWDEGITLVDGCTPCSPGCDHCWSAAQTHRFKRQKYFTDDNGRFNGDIQFHPDRLNRFHARKPKVFAIWNDLHHEAVPSMFKESVYSDMAVANLNTYLILTKRPKIMLQWYGECSSPAQNIWHGLTVCNQPEADEKIPIFLRVPGKKFLSLEPMLGEIDFSITGKVGGLLWDINAVILGGETGPGARPLHPDWVRSVRDQCAEAGVSFFFKSWGKHGLNWMNDENGKIDGSEWMDKGIKNPGRLLDGRLHDVLPWRKS